MADIHVLDPHIADLIAAGEVVERPASVVKELVENAIDAGATSVTIEIQRGGMALLRVADNGSGIPWEQCETAFLRHATSKLRTAEDLAAIGTLGFRGEALAAIASVARVELFTRTEKEEIGTSLTIEGGEILSKDRAGCPLGTTLVVRDLFYNTPARLKFMKRDAAEGAAVFAVVQKLALSHPEAAMKFIRDGKQELVTPGDGKLRSALYAVFGRELALGFVPVQGENEDIAVSGFVSLPACCRGSRSYQHFFVNGRQVKSKLLMTALEKAYENQKMVGKFPGCVLQVQLKTNTVDVNVHPAKTEVKFLYERKVFDSVYYTVLSALTGEETHPPLELPKPISSVRTALPLQDGGISSLLRPAAKPVIPAAPVAAPVSTPVPLPVVSPARSVSRETMPSRSSAPVSAEKPPVFPKTVEKTVENVEKPWAAAAKPESGSNPEPGSVPSPAVPPASEPVPPLSVPLGEKRPWRLVGEILQTYLLVEQGDSMLLIDKHAAHERMHFDRMKAEDYTPMAQTLLAPVIFTPAPEEGAILLENQALLARFGFACEDFGGGALAVRELPDYLEPGQAEGALCELALQLLSGGGARPGDARDTLLHTMACKAAIKGGQKNSREELLVVAEAVVSGQVKYCPHGRPVAIAITRAQLEKQFKRT